MAKDSITEVTVLYSSSIVDTFKDIDHCYLKPEGDIFKIEQTDRGRKIETYIPMAGVRKIIKSTRIARHEESGPDQF